jgi:TRAP-type C4-dicarboxylate transport system permease small subunit
MILLPDISKERSLILRCSAGFFICFEKVVVRVSKGMNVIGICSLGILMLLITSDVIGRYFFNRPLSATVDVAQFSMIIAVYFSVAYCAVIKGHVSVDMLVSKLPERFQRVIDLFTGLASLFLFFFVGWGASQQLLRSISRDEVSWTVGIPVWPFRLALLAGVLMLFLVLLIEIFHTISKVLKK